MEKPKSLDSVDEFNCYTQKCQVFNLAHPVDFAVVVLSVGLMNDL